MVLLSRIQETKRRFITEKTIGFLLESIFGFKGAAKEGTSLAEQDPKMINCSKRIQSMSSNRATLTSFQLNDASFTI